MGLTIRRPPGSSQCFTPEDPEIDRGESSDAIRRTPATCIEYITSDPQDFFNKHYGGPIDDDEELELEAEIESAQYKLHNGRRDHTSRWHGKSSGESLISSLRVTCLEYNVTQVLDCYTPHTK